LAGQTFWVWLATACESQKKPGRHGYAVGVVLFVLRQKPAEHVRHDAADVYVGPPSENVPGPHRFAPPSAVPAGQKAPGGQGFCVVPPVKDGHQ